MTVPRVSVLLPVYNGGAYLEAALASIFRQDFTDWEIIAIDDGSTDDSLKILKHAAADDPRVRITSRENRGLISTLNEGLALATGELVARMDADDIAYPHRLSAQVAAFDKDPFLAMCGSGYDTVIGDRIWRGAPDPMICHGDLRVLSQFFTIFIHSTVVFNRGLLGDGLRYDPSYVHAEDFDLFRRIAAQHPVRMLGESLIAYRLHDESVTSRHRKAMQKTHVRIVSESLQADGFTGDFAALGEIVEAITPEATRRCGRLLRQLGEQVHARPEALRKSYEAGLVNLFYFLFYMIRREAGADLVHSYLKHSDGWRNIRRREQFAYRLAPHTRVVAEALLCASRKLEDWGWRRRSMAASDADSPIKWLEP